MYKVKSVMLLIFILCLSCSKHLRLPESRTVSDNSTESGLKAGFTDDNKQFNYFIDFLNKYNNQVNHYPINVTERIIFKIKDYKGNNIPNAQIVVFAMNDSLCIGKTYSDGTFLFYPAEHDDNLVEYKLKVSYLQNDTTMTFNRSGERKIDLILNYSKSQIETIPLDILFILDTTGSMGEEILRLKKTIEIINLNLVSMSPKPEVRFGMVLYKDKNDEYTTKVIPLSANLRDFQNELDKIGASGGGDRPEDLQSALKDALTEINWNISGIRLSFIITDAPPHLDYKQKYTYKHAAIDAKKAGIKIFSIGTGGLDLIGEYILRQISQYTSSKYIFLTYGESGENEGGRIGSVSHHTGENYQTDKLEAIIIKITKEEISNFSDKPMEEEDEYFVATKIPEENREATLKKLFDLAIDQLLDYSTYKITRETPISMIPIVTQDSSQRVNSEYFTEHLLLSLSRNKNISLVERENLQEIMNEFKLSLTGLVNEENVIEIGELIGAKMLILGELYIEDEGYHLFLKLLRVETGEILSITKSKMDIALGI